MDNIKTYSTGQVSGMTDIPIRTIQAYVKDFRDSFSELARQRAKGRRFTDADVKNLLTIKRARNQRIPDGEIKKILSGEIDLPLASKYNDQDIKDMAINAAESLERATIIQRELSERLNGMRNAFGVMSQKVNRLEQKVKTLDEWQTYMMKKYPDDFNPWLEEQRQSLEKLEREQARDEKKIKVEQRRGWLHELLHPEEKYLNPQQPPPTEKIDTN